MIPHKLAPAHSETQTWLRVATAAILWWIAYTVLQPVTEFLTFDVLRMPRGSSLGESIAFFLYDVSKILLAFMMAVVGLSLPKTIILQRVLKPPLIAIFIGVVGLAIIITGYLFSLVM